MTGFSGSIPDWRGYLESLEDILEDILEQIDEDRVCNVRPDVSCLTAYDTLNQFLDAAKRELGI